MKKKANLDEMPFVARLFFALVVLAYGAYICSRAFGIIATGEIFIPLWLMKFIGICFILFGVIILVPLKRRGYFFLITMCSLICITFIGIAIWGTGTCSVTLLETTSSYSDLPCKTFFFLTGVLMIPLIFYVIRKG